MYMNMCTYMHRLIYTINTAYRYWHTRCPTRTHIQQMLRAQAHRVHRTACQEAFTMRTTHTHTHTHTHTRTDACAGTYE